jgi:SAM-dependent methyltransferase
VASKTAEIQQAVEGDEHSSYDPAYFARLFEIEDRHFWFRARNRVITTFVRQITSRLAPGYRMLEVGCGTGNVLRFLPDACPDGTVIGMDLFAQGLHFARQRTGSPLVQGDIHANPFGEQFELIGLFDVLEHLPDDIQVLEDVHRLLAPGGVLLLTVPAHRSLWSYFDEASHHCRRYELRELQAKLKRTGYQVGYISEYMMSIFPLVWLGRRLAARGKSKRGSSAARTDDLAMDELRVRPLVNEVLAWVLALEARYLARRRRLPVGTSVVAIAHKRGPVKRDA